MKLLTTFVAFTMLVVLSLNSTNAQAQFRGRGGPKLVVLEPVAYQHESKRVEAVGTAEALRSVVIFPAVSDEVTDVRFVPGQFVKTGQVLVKLDDRRQSAAVQRATLQLADAERNLQRLIESRASGAVPQSQVDDARTVRDLAKVTLDEAMTELDDRTIVAPFDGVVGITDVEIGDRITPQTPITTLDDRSQLYVNFDAPEAAVDILMENPVVTLSPWSNRTINIDATIAQIDSRIDETDRSIRARALLANDNDTYRPGMSFRVNLSHEGPQYAAVPEASLLWSAYGAYVWKAVEGKATRVNVEVKQRLRGTILVSGDLTQGEMLIVEGIQRLRNGQDVSTEMAQAN